MPTPRPDPPRGILYPRTAPNVRHARHLPSADLAPFVEHYWSVRWDLRGEAPLSPQTLPHPSVHAVFERGRSAIAGVHTKRFTRVLEGQGQVIAVKFKPGGFFPFIGQPLSAFANATRPMQHVFPADAADVEARLFATDDEPLQLAILEAFVRAQRPAPDANLALIEQAIAFMLRGATTRVEDVAAHVGMTLRTLQRLFQRYVGVGPKWVLRRYRLHEAAARLGAGVPLDQAALALALGYFDQAHFVRDFTALVGRSPASYAAVCAAPE